MERPTEAAPQEVRSILSPLKAHLSSSFLHFAADLNSGDFRAAQMSLSEAGDRLLPATNLKISGQATRINGNMAATWAECVGDPQK